MELKPGMRVRLEGLVARTELNGRAATLQRFVAHRGRWQVEVGDEATLIRSSNVMPLLQERLRAEAEDRMVTFAPCDSCGECAPLEVLRSEIMCWGCDRPAKMAFLCECAARWCPDCGISSFDRMGAET